MSHGVRVTLAAGDLHLSAEALAALRDHREAVVVDLGKRIGYEIVLVEFLNATHPDTEPIRVAAGAACPRHNADRRLRSANRVLYATWSEERRFQGDFETISG